MAVSASTQAVAALFARWKNLRLVVPRSQVSTGGAHDGAQQQRDV
jgi:hypothetical protein